MGVGSSLMAPLILIARQADAVGEVEVWERNFRAFPFYDRHVWTRDGTSPSRARRGGLPRLVHLP